MKMRQLKRILSVTLVSAMLATSVPIGTIAEDLGITKQVVQQTTETPTTEQPAVPTEMPTTEQPKVETPTTEQPKVETPTTEQPKVETPTTEQPKVETPTIEQTTTEKTAVETPSTEKPAEEQPTTEDEAMPNAGQATTETSTTETSTTETSTTETSATDVVVSWSLDGNEVVSGAESTWDGENKLLIAVANGADLEFKYEISRNGTPVGEVKEPGTYTVKAVPEGDTTGMNLTGTEIQFIINKVKVAFKWEDWDKSYTGDVITELPEVSLYSEGVDTGINAEVSVDGNVEIKDAKEYKFKAELKDTEHYETIPDTLVEKSLTVAPMQVAISWGGTSATYGGMVAPTAEYVIDNVKYDITEHITYDGTSVYVDGTSVLKNAGTYELKVQIPEEEGKNNYTEESGTNTLIINKKPIKAEWEVWPTDSTVEYDPDKNYGVPSVKILAVDDNSEISEEALGRSVAVVTKDGAGVKVVTNVGIYTATVQLAEEDSKNYDLTAASRVLEIRGADIVAELDWNAETSTVTFDEETNHVPTVTFTKDGNVITPASYSVKINGETVDENTEVINVGDYTATVTIEDERYRLVTTSNDTLKINAKTVDVKFTKDTYEYSYEPNGHGAELSGDYSSYGNATIYYKGENEESATADLPKAPGTYTASVVLGNSNYVANGTATVKIIGAEVEWTNTEATYTGEVPKPTATLNGEKLVVTLYGADDKPVEKKANAGKYKAVATLPSGYDSKHVSGIEYKDFEIKKVIVESISWENQKDRTVTVKYDGTEHTPVAKFDGVEKDGKALSLDVTVDGEKSATNADTYTATANIPDKYAVNYQLKDGLDNKTSFVIEQADATIEWTNTSVTYNGAPQKPVAKFKAVDAEANKDDDGKLTFTVTVEGEAADGAEDAGKYTASVKFDEYPNYKFEVSDASKDFVIEQADATIEWTNTSVTYNGAPQKPTAKFEAAKYDKNASDGYITCTVNVDATNAGEYKASVNIADHPNYSFNKETQTVDHKFEIKKLPISITPKGAVKLYGQKDPVNTYDYAVVETSEDVDLDAEIIAKELGAGNEILVRKAGELPGKYAYSLKTEVKETALVDNFKNFEPTLITAYEGQDLFFTINKITITGPESITSRQGTFSIGTDLNGNRDSNVVTELRITAAFPKTVDGINFSENINDYIVNASAGIGFTEASHTVAVKDMTYTRTVRTKETLDWIGKLPAGTVLTVEAVDGEENQTVVSSKSVKIKVNPVEFSFNAWSGFETSSTGNFVKATGGKAGILSINATGGDKEYVELLYNGTAAYPTLQDVTLTPDIINNGSVHTKQTATVSIVDTLNLVCASSSLEFYVDDQAFQIPSGSILFENRGQEITITLPEVGTVKSVTINGAEVTVSGAEGTENKFAVKWSGKALIPTGTAINVTYVDEAGHEGTGTAAASRSSVSTPISFVIRPALNENGYLGGDKGNTLIVSGTACACEPIRVTVADMSQSTYATQQDVWSDSNGSWEVIFDMSRLPEGQDFSVSAEYMDVSGAGYSVSARFDAYCASPAVLSPVYEAMTHISGMVEPGTAVALVVNGETQSYYEMKVDRFGRFSMDDVPMMFGGLDSFDIFVTDIAGNTSIRHYEIAEPGDPFEVTGLVNPLGKFFYSAERKDSVAYAATPVSANDFDEETNSVEIPLLMGMSYEVGTLTLQKTENGFTVSTAISVSKDIDPEDYRVENDKLYVYTERPTIEDLKNCTGQEYQYGAEIPLGADGKVWIVDNKDMTILADDIMSLELFDYENSEEYVKYQEQ